jgi:hypothetical protein
MLRGFVGILVSSLVLSPVTTAYIVDEYSKNSDIQEGKRLSSKLYERCIEMDTQACIGYKLLKSAANYFQKTTEIRSAETRDNGTRGLETEEQVDGILLQKFLDFVTSSIWTTSRTVDGASGKSRLLCYLILRSESFITCALGQI